MKSVRAACWVLGLVGLSACGSSQSDWSQASATHTVASYQAFIDKHPNTPQSVQARNRIAALQDEQSWAQALQAESADAFQSYLQQRPSGIHADEARDRISSIERMNAWYAASAVGSPEALQAFLQKYPHGPEADQARAHLAKLTGYRVELAAPRSQKLAEKTRDRMQDKYGDILGSVVVVPGPDGGQHVLSADMGPEEANSACAKLRKAHLSCEVIKDGKSTA